MAPDRRLSPGERLVWAAAFERALSSGLAVSIAVRLAASAVERLRVYSAAIADVALEQHPEARRMLAEMVEGGRED